VSGAAPSENISPCRQNTHPACPRLSQTTIPQANKYPASANRHKGKRAATFSMNVCLSERGARQTLHEMLSRSGKAHTPNRVKSQRGCCDSRQNKFATRTRKMQIPRVHSTSRSRLKIVSQQTYIFIYPQNASGFTQKTPPAGVLIFQLIVRFVMLRREMRNLCRCPGALNAAAAPEIMRDDDDACMCMRTLIPVPVCTEPCAGINDNFSKCIVTVPLIGA
jgi:hypothetical protein